MMMACQKPGANRQFSRRQTETFLGDTFGHTVDFKKHIAGTDNSRPILWSAFAFTHTGFRGAGCHGFVGENPDPKLAFAFHVAGDGDTGGLDLGILQPATVECLKAEFTIIDFDIAGRETGTVSPLGFAIFDSGWE